MLLLKALAQDPNNAIPLRASSPKTSACTSPTIFFRSYRFWATTLITLRSEVRIFAPLLRQRSRNWATRRL